MSFAGKLTLHSATELICEAGKQIQVHHSSVIAQNVSWSTVCGQSSGVEVWHSFLWCDSVPSCISYNFPSNTQETHAPPPRVPHCGDCAAIHLVVQIIFDSYFSLISSLWVHLVGFLQNVSHIILLLSTPLHC